MSDTSRLPLPPASPELAFLELGERLRRRGQLEAAESVALAGLAHYPALADAHDLLGRIRSDLGDAAGATDSWRAALECDPGHLGAHKGLAWAAFRADDLAAAERHLEQAALGAPRDAGILAALDRVRSSRPDRRAELALRLDDPASGVVLADREGLRVVGTLGPDRTDTQADAAAAVTFGLYREAERAARLLALGTVRHLVIESGTTRAAVLAVGDSATVLIRRPVSTPLGRLLALAGRATTAAREWFGSAE